MAAFSMQGTASTLQTLSCDLPNMRAALGTYNLSGIRKKRNDGVSHFNCPQTPPLEGAEGLPVFSIHAKVYCSPTTHITCISSLHPHRSPKLGTSEPHFTEKLRLTLK